METYDANDPVDVPSESQTGTTNTDQVLKTIDEVAKQAMSGVTTAITCQNESLFSCDAIDGSSNLYPQKSSRFTLQRIIAQVQVIGFRCCRRVRVKFIGIGAI